jgi:hypothetical protein
MYASTPVMVSRAMKDKPAFLQFATTITFSPEHQAVMGTLTKDQVDTVIQEISLELARTRVGSAIGTMSLPQTGTNGVGQTMVVLQKAAPIGNLTEARFADAVDDIEFTVSLVRAAANLSLRHVAASRLLTKAPAAH